MFSYWQDQSFLVYYGNTMPVFILLIMKNLKINGPEQVFAFDIVIVYKWYSDLFFFHDRPQFEQETSFLLRRRFWLFSWQAKGSMGENGNQPEICYS